MDYYRHKSLSNRLAKAQEEANALAATQIKQKSREMQIEQRRLLVEMKVHGIKLDDLITEENKK